MSRRFDGRRALVVGGGSGIGRAVAIELAREGAAVTVAGRTEEHLLDTVAAVERVGGSARPLPMDVRDEAQVRAGVLAAAGDDRRLDVAVNCAGTQGAAGPVDEVDERAWTALIDVNLNGIWRCVKHELTLMREQGQGAIVNVASNIGAHMALPNLAAYATSKAGVSALTRAAALDAIGDGVRINAVSPGPVDTPMSLLPGESREQRAERMKGALPIGRVASTEEVAAAVLWLASDEAGFAVGHDLVLDGGASA